MALLCSFTGSGSPSRRIPGLLLGSRDRGCGGGPDSAELSHSTTSTNTSLENVQDQGGAGTGSKARLSLLGSTSSFTQSAPWSEAAGL